MTCFPKSLFLLKSAANVSNFIWSSTLPEIFTELSVPQVWHVFLQHFSHSKVPQMRQVLYDPVTFKKSSLIYQCRKCDMFFHNTFLIERCRKCVKFYMIRSTSRHLYLFISAANMACFSTTLFTFKGAAHVSNFICSGTLQEIFSYLSVPQVWHVFLQHFSHSKVLQMCQIFIWSGTLQSNLYLFVSAASMTCFYNTFLIQSCRKCVKLYMIQYPSRNLHFSLSAASMTCFSTTLFLFKGAANVSNFYMIRYASRNLICQCRKYDMLSYNIFLIQRCCKCVKIFYDPVHFKKYSYLIVPQVRV
jgi:hypothetical protein